jgi:hypothetical protein
VFAYICFKDSFAQGCLLLIFFLCITNRESLYKLFYQNSFSSVQSSTSFACRLFGLLLILTA